MEIGKKVWAIAEGYIPGWSHGPGRDFISPVPARVCHEWKEDSFQCFIGDEGRPFTYALQEEYVNRFMVL